MASRWFANEPDFFCAGDIENLGIRFSRQNSKESPFLAGLLMAATKVQSNIA